MGLPLFTISKTSLCFVFSKFETRASIIFTLLLFKFLQTNPIFSIKLHGKVIYVTFDFFYQIEIWKSCFILVLFLGKNVRWKTHLNQGYIVKQIFWVASQMWTTSIKVKQTSSTGRHTLQPILHRLRKNCTLYLTGIIQGRWKKELKKDT